MKKFLSKVWKSFWWICAAFYLFYAVYIWVTGYQPTVLSAGFEAFLIAVFCVNNIIYEKIIHCYKEAQNPDIDHVREELWG